MGSGTTKEQKTIRVVTIYSKLENLLDQLENALISFENETFSTIEELNALLIKQQIDSLQNQINDELINIRTELKKIKNKAEYDMKNKTILPFITHGGGGIGHAREDIEKICSNARVVNTFDANDATEEKITDWLHNAGVQWREKVGVK